MPSDTPSKSTTTLPPPKQRHFLQSDEWAAFQQALGHTVIQDQGDGWSYMAIVERGHGPAAKLGPRLYAPYGPTYNSPRALRAALDSMRKQAARHHCTYLRVEPLPTGQRADEASLSLIKSARDSQPGLTLAADLTRSFDDLLLDCTKTNRYLWRRQADYDLSFTCSYDVDQMQPFLDMMASTGSRSGATFHTANYYRTMIQTLGPSKTAGILYAMHDGQPVAGMLFVDDHPAKTRYYMHAGSFEAARKLNAMSIMLMDAMHYAHEHGMERFDFFGVSPADNPNHRWAGFSKFKRSFGGTDVAYPGTYELPIARTRYSLLQAMRRVRN